VRPRHKTLTHYFLGSGEPGAVSIKSTGEGGRGSRYTELMFLYPVVSAGHVVHFGASRGAKHRRTIFHAWVGSVQIQQKACWV
jgi:hypothetical protein